MNLTMLRCSILLLAMAIGTLGLVSRIGAQENLDRGKTPAQLFASDCSICHKSPQGLARAGGPFGLDSFLRTHYTASRESAGAIANYLKSIDIGPAGRATRRTAKGDDKAQPADRKKSATKPGEIKGTRKKTDADASKAAEPSEPLPPAILAPERRSDAKPKAPSTTEAKPAERAKSEKSD